jgi:hypothetical protein
VSNIVLEKQQGKAGQRRNRVRAGWRNGFGLVVREGKEQEVENKWKLEALLLLVDGNLALHGVLFLLCMM